jgi:hypothetical protein
MANGSTYTASIYAKAGTRSAVALEIWNGSTAKYCYADLSNGTVISGSDASATVTSVGSGWYRLTVQHTGLGNAGSGSSLYLMPAAVNNVTYSGNGSGNAYIWGAQIALTTESAFMYLPTNGTAVASGATYLGQDKSLGSSITYGNNWNAVMSMTVGTSYDAMTDAPYPVSATVGNYCTLDPLNNGNAVTPTITLSDANLKVVFGNTNTNAIAGTTIGMTSGKFYCEGQITVVGGNYPFIGILPLAHILLTGLVTELYRLMILSVWLLTLLMGLFSSIRMDQLLGV